MTAFDVFDGNHKNIIRGSLFSLIFFRGAHVNAGNKNITDLIFPRPVNDVKITFDTGGVVMMWVIVTDGDDI